MNIYEEIDSAFKNVRLENNGTITGEAVFPPEFVGFKGHFPDKPIVPGVCLLDAARILIEKVQGRKLELKKVRSVKFLSVIQPGESIRFEITVDEKEGETIAAVMVLKGDESAPVSKMKFSLAEYIFQDVTKK